MPTTTNYGWTTPADTDLVKDGAAAIRTLGTAIDTTVFNNAGSAIAKTIVDAKGDIIAATAADTVSRLAVGANDTVLTADSSTATGLKWGTLSGAMTSLASGSIAASATGLDLQSISSSYKRLDLYLSGVSLDGANTIGLRFNNDSGTTYSYQNFYIQSSALDGNDGQTSARITRATTAAFTNGAIYISIPNYTSSTAYKIASVLSTPGNASATTGHIQWNSAAAIDRITIIAQAGSFDAGTYELFGVK